MMKAGNEERAREKGIEGEAEGGRLIFFVRVGAGAF